MLHCNCAFSQHQNFCLTRGCCPCSGLSAQCCIWRPRSIPGTWRLSTLHRVHLWGLQCWPSLWGLRQLAGLWVKPSSSGVRRFRLSAWIWGEHGNAGFWGLGLGAWLRGWRSCSAARGRGGSAWLWWWLHPYVWHSRWGFDAAQEAAQLLSMGCCLIVMNMNSATCLQPIPVACCSTMRLHLGEQMIPEAVPRMMQTSCCTALDKAASCPATGRLQVPSVHTIKSI